MFGDIVQTFSDFRAVEGLTLPFQDPPPPSTAILRRVIRPVRVNRHPRARPAVALSRSRGRRAAVVVAAGKHGDEMGNSEREVIRGRRGGLPARCVCRPLRRPGRGAGERLPQWEARSAISSPARRASPPPGPRRPAPPLEPRTRARATRHRGRGRAPLHDVPSRRAGRGRRARRRDGQDPLGVLLRRAFSAEYSMENGPGRTRRRRSRASASSPPARRGSSTRSTRRRENSCGATT